MLGPFELRLHFHWGGGCRIRNEKAHPLSRDLFADVSKIEQATFTEPVIKLVKMKSWPEK
jgi:hypothetical protein